MAKPVARLGFLDALRGIAVLLVLFQHVGELTWSAIPAISRDVMDIGQLGVMIFFCCSGFIIPVSLERTGRLGSFWTRRFFRLFPLYWFSLTLAFAFARWLDMPSAAVTPADWLANVTMLQHFLGRPDALGLYWSLAWEMAFYLLISLLFLFRLHRNPVLLGAVINAGLVAAVLAWSLTMPGRHFPVGLFSIVLMFTGYAAHQWFAGLVRTSTIILTGCSTVLTGIVVLVTTSASGLLTDPTGVARRAHPLGMAWLGALLVFASVVVVARAGRQFPAWLRRWGTISYSVYLMQALVIAALDPTGAPPWLDAVLWTAGTVLVSELTYRFIETPGIAVGRRISRRRRPAGAAAAAGQPGHLSEHAPRLGRLARPSTPTAWGRR
jgi:peptidoglycan/LPS O-acetylase OafA/YrhL